MSRREVIAYAITHAPKGVKGGPYEGPGSIGSEAPSLRQAERWDSAPAIAYMQVRAIIPHARVIRIVRKAQLEVGAAKESAAFEAETWREVSAVEVLRELVAWDDAPSEGQLEPTIHRARRVIAASGPDPSEVVRAALKWERACRRSAARAVDLELAMLAAVDAYRKAGGK